MAGVSRTTVYSWLNSQNEISRKTLQHKLDDDDPVGELARMVEWYYQVQDKRQLDKNDAQLVKLYREMGGVKIAHVNLKAARIFDKPNWIEGY